MDHQLFEVLATIPEKEAPKGVPCDPKILQEIEHEYDIKLPNDYKAFLLKIGHGTISGLNRSIYIERASSLIGYNLDEEFDAIPGMFVIGDDGGGGVYYYDTQNILGFGEYAMFLVHLGSIDLKYSRFVGQTLTEVIMSILQGESFYDRPTQGEL